MSLTGRLTLAMVALVVLTAAAVGWLSYRLVQDSLLPREIEQADVQMDREIERMAAALEGVQRELPIRVGAVLDSFVRASRAGDAAERDLWRGRLAARLAGELEAKPNFRSYRVIGVADGGRELVRVDRSGLRGAIRIVPDDELQRKGDRDYMVATLALPDGAVYVSPVDLEEDGGVIAAPDVPTLRIASPIYVDDALPFGIMIINLDLRPLFGPLRSNKFEGQLFLVNDAGDYLVHPDRTREFGFQLGRRYRIQEDFPEAAEMMKGDDPLPRIISGPGGESTVLMMEGRLLAGTTRVVIARAIPLATMMGAVAPVRKATLFVGIGAVLTAIGLAILLARSLALPLAQMTHAVEGLAEGRPFEMPQDVSGEVAVLAQAFATTTRELGEHNEKMRRDAEIFDTILGNLADPVMLLDGEGRWIYANPAAHEIYGDLTGRGTYTERKRMLLTRPDGTALPDAERPVARLLRGDTLEEMDLVQHDIAGTPHEYVVNGRAIKDADGKVRAVVVLQHDVTAVREAERRLQQAQRLEAVGQLTGGVAHDFNNILTVIFGALEFIAEDVSDRPELLKLTAMINTAAQRGAGLIGQLLAFARRQPLAPEETDVNALVLEATGLLRQTLGENIEISLSLEATAWRAIVDPSLLATGLLNLAVNARDAMPHGGRLTIETGNVTLDDSYVHTNPDAAPGDYIQVAVSDSGTGIPAELLGKVLEPFFTTKPIGKGTGLGLSMVYGFVRQSGGHLKIYSEVGHGTTVRLYLPRFFATGAATVRKADDTELPRGRETILVVEDDKQVRELAVNQIGSLGYTVHAAESGPHALALVDDGLPFDLLFTDVVMPGGMNGRELASEIARRRPGLKVLFTSGYTENAIVHQGRLDPGVALLPKPYRKATLAQKLRDALDGLSAPA